ncbi:hypothetical protein [Pseudoalteromonas rubra]|uniref:hypothetical protein n=1 Tax=Pseudoalteromonas rubra TaxID=43658 RepID=UPI002DB6D98A|nr:hypothetical protein [Pseudoalteromonas rubra]MEC4091751.1 hypothetical protein [Pseudoalteromonas rubra]
MYRQTNKASKIIVDHMLIKNNVRSQQPENYVETQVIPNFRRMIEFTDYDNGQPITHKLELYKTDRSDSYKVFVDGKPNKERIEWINILAGIRKVLPRLVRA